jgi:hypothetical protein
MKLYIPRDRESHHIQILGSTGTRKSSIIIQLVDQAIARRLPIVFIDLKREYLERYFRPGIDHIIDFGDERCSRWALSREAMDEPHAMPIADGAFPDEPGRSFFFQDHARAILAYLLGHFHPTTSELAYWFANPEQIDMRLVGSEHASTMSKNSYEQRNGILGTLNHLGRALRWMPDEDGRREFCVREWAAQGKQRKGSIFLSSSPTTFSALRPMQSLIFDMILLGLQTYPGPGMVVADEIGEFQRCPQLERAMSMQRSSGCPLILAYQGFTQLETHYGEKQAESISTNAYTNIVLRTAAGRSAKHASELLGLPSQVERVRESKSSTFMERQRHNFSAERVMDSAVTPGEIQTLEDGHGFLSQAGRIVKIHVDYMPPVRRNPKLIERMIPSTPSILARSPVSIPTPKPYKSKYTKQSVLDIQKSG